MPKIVLTVEATADYDLDRLATRLEDFIEFHTSVTVVESAVEV